MPRNNKTFLAVALTIAVVVIGGALFTTFGSANIREMTFDKKTANAQARLASTDPDRDADGLKDWEETLWGTRTDNPDTDGDGTNDGNEVSVGRDPTKAGVDSVVGPAQEEGSAGESTESVTVAGSDTLTETQKFSQGLISKYLYTKLTAADGAELTDDKLVSLAENAFSTVKSPDAPNRYTLKDLRVVNDSSAAALEAYGNALGVAIFDAPGEKMEYELTIIRGAVSNRSPEELEKLKPVIASYRTTAERIVHVSVPAEIAATHLEVANNLAKTADALEKMSEIFDDPLLALSWSKIYFSSIDALNEDVGKIVSLFTGRGVTFTKSSPGYAFTLLYTPPIIDNETNQRGS